jgi:hypothetical protein
MQRKVLLYVLAFIISASFRSEAQVFGGNPSSLKFYQFNTDTVRVIFPLEMEAQAREIVWLTHQLAKNAPAQLGSKQKKFSVVLQNQTTESNAYVGPAPWRSEFYMMPDLSNLFQTSQQWHQTLVVHEQRHMQQFANFKRGPQKTGGVLLGQEGQVLMMGMVVPDWFWEGDAVWQETVTTQQGRGRLPNFFNPYRSLWLAGKDYSYQKLRNGSFRHFVPNHYDLGYLLVGYGIEKYGDDFWKKVTSEALDFKGLFYPFQKAVKRNSNLSFKKFIKSSFDFYKGEMKVKNLSVYDSVQVITRAEKNSYTEYQFPYVLEDGSVLALKRGYRQIPVWVKIKNGNEIKLRVKDIGTDPYYSCKNGTIVYTAFEPDARWGWKNFSVIKLLNINSNEVTQLTVHSKLFMPDVSADSEKVIAVKIGTDGKNSLQLIHVNSATINDLPNISNYQYTYPRFTADDSGIISAVRNSKGEMTLAKTILSTGEETLLMPFVNTPIGFVQVQGDTVLFTAPCEGKDVLYFFNQKQNTLFKVAELPNGNYQAVVNAQNNEVIFTSFDADGIMLLSKKLKPVMADSLKPLTLLYNSAGKHKHEDVLQNVQAYTGSIKEYNAFTKPINIHSWRPQLTEPDYGITFYGQNILNTITTELSYNYNRNEGFHRTGVNLLLGKWYPVFSIGASQTWNRSDVINRDTTITWNQTNANFVISLPLNLTKGRTFKSLNFSSSVNTERLSFTGQAKSFLSDDTFNYISSSVSFVNQNQRARQQIFPKWAQTFRIQYRRTVNGDFGNQFFANAGFYFPGFFRNHHLVLFGSVYARDTIRGSFFTNSFPFARGYNAINFPRAFRLSANYHFPVVYPETGVGNIIFIQRIRANTFYDYTRGRSLRTGRLFPLSTAGCEVFFDSKIWNLFEASFGIRYSRLLNNDLAEPGRSANQFELVLPLDLF